MNKKVRKILLFLGVPTDFFGFLYIEEAVLIAMTVDSIYGSMTKNIYPTIAKNHRPRSKKI